MSKLQVHVNGPLTIFPEFITKKIEHNAGLNACLAVQLSFAVSKLCDLKFKEICKTLKNVKMLPQCVALLQHYFGITLTIHELSLDQIPDALHDGKPIIMPYVRYTVLDEALDGSSDNLGIATTWCTPKTHVPFDAIISANEI